MNVDPFYTYSKSPILNQNNIPNVFPQTQKCVFTLSAMTAGIRRNWIQALMKNVHPSNAPDVAR